MLLEVEVSFNYEITKNWRWTCGKYPLGILWGCRWAYGLIETLW